MSLIRLGASLFLGGELLNFRGVTMCWNDLYTLDLKKKNDAYFLPICRWHHYIIHFFGNMLYFVFFKKS